MVNQVRGQLFTEHLSTGNTIELIFQLLQLINNIVEEESQMNFQFRLQNTDAVPTSNGQQKTLAEALKEVRNGVSVFRS